MRKLLAAGILAVFGLFLPSKSHAVPLDVPYGGDAFTITSSTGIILSSGALRTSSYQWCVEHIAVSVGSTDTFSMYFSSMNTLTPSTTNYVVVVTSNSPYDTTWASRTPYCIPPGDYLGITNSVSGSTVTLEGYTFGGWSNP
jgi:hypothetical protein